MLIDKYKDVNERTNQVKRGDKFWLAVL